MQDPAIRTTIDLPPFTIDPATTIGAVHLIVRNRERMQYFYSESLGFRAIEREGRIELSADGRTPLFALTENRMAQRPPARATGLYHTAIRVPSRRDLARLLIRLAATQTRLQGASDHLVSEALYLSDPEGNGLEFYHDRPREEWPRENGGFRLDTLPLDLENLILDAGTEAWAGLHPETVVGHVHLRVSNLDAADEFYLQVLGFERMAAIPNQAGFVSAAGYHHHIGYNVWTSRGAPPPPPDSTGLDFFTVRLPDQNALTAVVARLRKAALLPQDTAEGVRLRDPAGNGLLLTAN